MLGCKQLAYLLTHQYPCRYTGADTDASRRPARLATPLPEGLLSWTKAVWQYPEADVIQQCGMDVAVFFRLLHLGRHAVVTWWRRSSLICS